MDGQKAHEKKIANYERNASQNYNEMSSHTGQNAHHQKIYKPQMLKRVWEKRAILPCWWECKSMRLENSMQFP